MIKFRKLYERTEDGWMPHSIIAYKSTDWTIEQCNHGEVGHQVAIEYKRQLQIDFWVFIWRKDWVKKRPNMCPYKKREEV